MQPSTALAGELKIEHRLDIECGGLQLPDIDLAHLIRRPAKIWGFIAGKSSWG